MTARTIAPELPSGLDWINASQPPSLAALRGRVVLLNFWTFDSVNCTNALPDVKYLENKYHDGLTVIGVHTPKYDYQRQAAPVLKAVNRHHIRHAVVNDPEFKLWQAYGVQAWPTMALVDAQTQLAAVVPGEGRRDQVDAMIARLLDEAAGNDQRVYETSVAMVRPEPRMPLYFPTKLLVAGSSLWVADSGRNRILECNFDGRVLRQFGSGNPGLVDERGQEAGFNTPQGLAMLRDALYVADTGNHALRRIRLHTGEVETVAGTGTIGHDVPNEGVDARNISMSSPADVAAVGDKLYVAVAGQHQIWRFDPARNALAVVAGSGHLGTGDGTGIAASFAQPSALSVVGEQVLIADAAGSAIRSLRVADAQVTTLIGAGLYEFGDDNGKRESARLQNPLAVCADPRGVAFVADSYNGKVRVLNLRTGELRSLNLQYRFLEPAGLALGGGALWVANTNAHELVRIDIGSGQIRRVPVGE
ncbi:MAG TPA: thioredoxin-like domain-containing protein [Rudaea sp.]